MLTSSQLLHKFGRTLSFLYWWPQLLSVPTSLCLLLTWMNMSTYDILFTVFLSFVSTLNLITSFLGSTSSTFLIRSLFEVGPICRLSMFFHHMFTSRNFTNSAPYRALVKKSASMCSVLHYEINMLLLPTLSFTKK